MIKPTCLSQATDVWKPYVRPDGSRTDLEVNAQGHLRTKVFVAKEPEPAVDADQGYPGPGVFPTRRSYRYWPTVVENDDEEKDDTDGCC